MSVKKISTAVVVGVLIAIALIVLAPLFMKATAVIGSGKLYPIYRVDTERRAVALTVNCAWEDTDTDRFLQTLAERNLRLTFFVTGEFAARCQNAVVRLHAAGQEIGNHSDKHPDMAKLTAEQIARDVTAAGRKIEKIIGKTPTLFRAPSGSYTDTVIQTAQDNGYRTIQWDCDTLDWKGLSAEEQVTRVMKKVQNGSIILMHLGAEHSAEALPLLLDALAAEGYEILPVSELIHAENDFVDRQGVQHTRT